MLIKRLITGVVLLLGVFYVIFFANPNYFSWIILLLLIGSAWEWGNLIGVTAIFQKISLVVTYALLIPGFFLGGAMALSMLPLLLLVCSLWWCFACLIILLYAKGRARWVKRTWVGFLMGLPTLGSLYLGLLWLPVSPLGGRTMFFYFILLIATADSVAYFSGRMFGKRKLLPMLSPNKTWCGFVGGVLGSTCVAVAGSIYFHLSFKQALFFVVVSFIAVLFSVVGDLFISLLKRQQQLKDTGRLLPGHGGLLDRLDGLSAAIPVFILGLFLMNFLVK